MSGAGRPPKPTAIKAAEGNRGRRPLNEAELGIEAVIPPCPSWLDAGAKKEWRRLSRLLYNLGVIREVDQAALAMLCSALSTRVAAQKELDAMKEGTRFVFKTEGGSIQMNPLLAVINRQTEIVHRIGADFGLTPAARVKILAGELPSVPRRGPSMEELLSGPVEHDPADPPQVM